ncbi:hypothetical protein [Plebeiibacterium marinum]|uniref:Uncharacterized protein n=1 Tax=Plebeiibacterium marinum TaxID=2992111 RepID=A0AAE3ME34_9BACT|nr:hypothetical protein [Plebeiobacterium marinum]MCW3805902.1 hypothetical protein [Plebeiobacterium marinum]
MSKVDFSFNISLDDSEFIQVGDNIYTTQESIHREQPAIHFIGSRCLDILKHFEGRLTTKIINDWLLLIKAMDQTTSSRNKWDNYKIIEELINGQDHSVSWYVNNCAVA